MRPPRRSSRTRAAASAAFFLPFVHACAGAPDPVTPPIPADATGSACPLPLVFAPGEVRPRWVRLRNPGSRTLTVFLDRCFWHTLLAQVPPGGARQVRLPGELVPFGADEPGELRFHVFDTDARRYSGTFQVPVRPEPVVRLDLDLSGAARGDTLPGYSLPEGEERSAERTLVTDEVLGYTSVWGVGGGGVLSWACREEQAWLSLALGRKARGKDRPEVEVRMSPGDWEALGPWEVVASVTDAVVAPLEVAGPLTARLLAVDRASFRVRDRRRDATVYTFELAGLEAAFRRLPCSGSVLGGRDPAPGRSGRVAHPRAGGPLLPRERARPD